MFGGDPFDPFSNMRRHMTEMDRMMSEPFGMMNQMNRMMNHMLGSTFGHQPMLGFDEDNGRRQQNRQPSNMAGPMDLFGGFGFGGGLMQHAMNDPNSMVFSQSTMITMNPDGTQHVVSNSTRKAGDVKETRKAVRNGDDERVSIGHHIGDRAHYVEKKRDANGQFRQKQKFINLDEEEAEHFNNEFKHRANRNLSNLFGGAPVDNRRAIGGSGRSNARDEIQSGSGSSAPIVTIPDDDEDERPRGSNRYRDDDDVVYMGSRNRSGPTIREISDEEAAQTERNKRRKGGLGRFFGANDD